MKYMKNVNCKNRMWLKLGWLAACVPIVLVILLINLFFGNMSVDGNCDTTEMSADGYHDTEDGQNLIADFAPADVYPYYGVTLPYAILRIDDITDESVRLGSVTDIENAYYIKVRCSILYQCSYHCSYTLDLSKLNEIYIVSETTKGLAADDVIFVQVEERNLNGNYYYCPITNNGQAEYIPIIDDHIVLKGDEFYTESFFPLEQYNRRINETKKYIERGGVASDYSNALPQDEFRENMTINALIDYLSAWEKAVKIVDEERKMMGLDFPC